VLTANLLHAVFLTFFTHSSHFVYFLTDGQSATETTLPSIRYSAPSPTHPATPSTADSVERRYETQSATPSLEDRGKIHGQTTTPAHGRGPCTCRVPTTQPICELAGPTPSPEHLPVWRGNLTLHTGPRRQTDHNLITTEASKLFIFCIISIPRGDGYQ
jgi:hypothetical protein